MERYRKKSARPGEVEQLSKPEQLSDLPRRAEAKVAWHLLDRRADPSSKEGISTALNGVRTIAHLSEHFPVSSEEDSFFTRREFTKFLGLASLAFFAGTAVAAGRKLWKRVTARDTAAIQVATLAEVPVGGYKLFRYPTENDPCILLRLEPEKFVAFNQSCTHLSCPVLFNAESRQLECPCHKGFFSAGDGRVLAGPPKRPLETLRVSLRGDRIWVKHESES